MFFILIKYHTIDNREIPIAVLKRRWVQYNLQIKKHTNVTYSVRQMFTSSISFSLLGSFLWGHWEYTTWFHKSWFLRTPPNPSAANRKKIFLCLYPPFCLILSGSYMIHTSTLLWRNRKGYPSVGVSSSTFLSSWKFSPIKIKCVL